MDEGVPPVLSTNCALAPVMLAVTTEGPGVGPKFAPMVARPLAFEMLDWAARVALPVTFHATVTLATG